MFGLFHVLYFLATFVTSHRSDSPVCVSSLFKYSSAMMIYKHPLSNTRVLLWENMHKKETEKRAITTNKWQVVLCDGKCYALHKDTNFKKYTLHILTLIVLGTRGFSFFSSLRCSCLVVNFVVKRYYISVLQHVLSHFTWL